ncbi:MEDS domain-containing protein [candidate division KSB1 bacterium]
MESADLMQSLSQLKPGKHLCFLYDRDEDHRSFSTAYMRLGLERGEKVLYITDARPADAIFDYLRNDGLEIEPYIHSGQLTVLSSHDVYMKDGVFDPDKMIAQVEAATDQALAEGYSALRATGEMSWALTGMSGSERLIEYESKLNDYFPESKCLAVCQYDRRLFKPELLLNVLSTHPGVIVGSGVYENSFYMPPSEIPSDYSSPLYFDYRTTNLSDGRWAEELD